MCRSPVRREMKYTSGPSWACQKDEDHLKTIQRRLSKFKVTRVWEKFTQKDFEKLNIWLLKLKIFRQKFAGKPSIPSGIHQVTVSQTITVFSLSKKLFQDFTAAGCFNFKITAYTYVGSRSSKTGLQIKIICIFSFLVSESYLLWI